MRHFGRIAFNYIAFNYIALRLGLLVTQTALAADTEQLPCKTTKECA